MNQIFYGTDISFSFHRIFNWEDTVHHDCSEAIDQTNIARIKLVIGSVVKSDLDRVPANFTSHLDCTCKQIAVENSTFIIFVNREYGA